MAFLATTLGSPTLCIRGGVQYEQQTLSPHSGLYDFSNPLNNNWSFTNCLDYQNARVRGSYSLEDNFEQGYFNFENWSGPVCYSTDGTKSGYYSLPFPGSQPPLANFWGRGESQLVRDALYNYGFAGTDPSLTVVPKNIGIACVMSGVSAGFSGIYPDLKVYIGSIPSGQLTIYGRVGSVNSAYPYNDKILSFDVIPSGSETSMGSAGPLFPSSATNNPAIGNKSWNTPSNMLVSDSNPTSCTLDDNTTDLSTYLVATNFGLSIPPDASINGIELLISRKNGTSFSLNNIIDSEIKLTSGGTIFPTNKADVGNWPVIGGFQTKVYGGSADSWGRSWSSSEINSSTFGVAIAVACTNSSNPASAEVDYVTIAVTYSVSTPEGPNVYGTFSLLNFDQGTNRRLCWFKRGFDNVLNIDTNIHKVTSKRFSNFLLTYSKITGIAKFYTAYDGEPLVLENIVSVGDISSAFTGLSTFHEDSYIYGNTINPKIVTDYGISNREWTDSDIRLFDNHRLNGAYWTNDFSLSNPPSPSGADTTALTFHFPPRSSGLIGSCHSGNYRATDYYIPLYSGVSQRLSEFDRSQFNSGALSLDMWVSNTGTNPSGNLGARIDFCTQSDYFARPLFSVQHTWSGYPVQIPSGISQVRMSGKFFNSVGGPSDLAEVSKDEANTAGLFLGTWYNDLGREYNGDLKVYSARVSLDGFVAAPKASGSIPLYCSGKPLANNSIDLYLHNHLTYSSVDLFLGGHGVASGQLNFFISGSTTNGSIPLYTKGVGVPGSVNNNLTLYTQGPLNGNSNASMNLFLKSEMPSSNGSIDLFCANYFAAASGQLNLFLQGASSIPVSGAMNLFLARDSESVAHNMPLFVSGPNSANAEIPLVINGANITTGQVPLYTDGIGHSTGTIKLFTHGY